jgi:hypothetical protein
MKDVLVETVFGRKLKSEMTLEKAIQMLKDLDLIDIGELAEQAISKTTKIARCSKNTPDIDLVSGVQIKHAQTNTEHIVKSQLNAWISIKDHTAPILAVVTERVTKKQYFFHIPYRVYSKQNGNAICVPFESDGTPRLSNHWWRCQIPSYEALCELAK